MCIRDRNCLVVDLRAKIEANQAYVMISRVQELRQLLILGHLPEQKIFASIEALEEHARMKTLALNNKMKDRTALVASMNIYSLKKHHPDLKTSAKITTSEVVCVQETWIEPNQDDTNKYQIPEFNVHFNSVGRGKGIAT